MLGFCHFCRKCDETFGRRVCASSFLGPRLYPSRGSCYRQYRDLLIVLPMRAPSIFRALPSVIGSNVEIDVVALNWV